MGGALFSPLSSHPKKDGGVDGTVQPVLPLQPLSPGHLRQSPKMSWEEDAGEPRMSLRMQGTNSTGKSWKA